MSPVEVTWLGQSGYAIRGQHGETCLIDPYLSEYVKEELGVPRVAPIVLDPASAVADVVVATHWHPDHLDRRTCVPLALGNPGLTFVGPPGNTSRLSGWGIPPERIRTLERGDSLTVGAFTFHATFARHDVPGWLAEDAIGVVVEIAGVRIFHSGDTEYDSRVLAARALGPLDLGLFVTNGSGGNMNALEAALLAHQLAPAVAIPNHYGMWEPEGYGPDATIDPQTFVVVCARLGGPPTRVLDLGETIEVPPARRP